MLLPAAAAQLPAVTVRGSAMEAVTSSPRSLRARPTTREGTASTPSFLAAAPQRDRTSVEMEAYFEEAGLELCWHLVRNAIIRWERSARASRPPTSSQTSGRHGDP